MCGVVCELNSVCAVAENVCTCVLKVCERVCEFNSMCVCVGTVCVVYGKITTDRPYQEIGGQKDYAVFGHCVIQCP